MVHVELVYTFQPVVEVSEEEARRIVKKAYRKLYGSKWRKGYVKGVLGKSDYERLGKGRIRVRDLGKAAKAIVLLESYGFVVGAELKPETAKDDLEGARLYREASKSALEVASLISQGCVDEALSKAYELREKLVHAHLISTGYYGSITSIPYGYETIEGALIKLMQQRVMGRELDRNVLERMPEALKAWSMELEGKARTIETLALLRAPAATSR